MASYREAVAAWGALKVKLDAKIIRLPRTRDAEYDEVIREWELVLNWSVQHGADEEAVVAREMLGELRERREKPRQPPVTHSDRLWSRFRPEQQVLEELAALAMNSGSVDMEQFRFEMLKRRGMFAISELLLTSAPSTLSLGVAASQFGRAKLLLSREPGTTFSRVSGSAGAAPSRVG